MRISKLAFLLLLSTSAQAAVYVGCKQLDPSDYSDYDVLGAPGALKMFHVTGKHRCSSRENLGYMVDVEVRDATDCASGHQRNKFNNPCRSFNGVPQTCGMSLAYIPGACSPFF